MRTHTMAPMASLFDDLSPERRARDAEVPASGEADDLDFCFGFNLDTAEIAPAWEHDSTTGEQAGVLAAEPVARDEDPLLQDLTPPQREAVLHDRGPLIVSAGPGSGKTRVLTHRVAYLIIRRNVTAYRILAVTFTNKAAGEMRVRIDRLRRLHDPAGYSALSVRVSTFHSFCAAMLRRYGPPQRTPDFTIYDDDDQKSLLRRIIKELELAPSQWRAGRVLSRISKLKNGMVTATEFDERAFGYRDQQFARIFLKYEEALEQFNGLDFDDLLLYMVRLLQENEDVRRELRERFRYVLIDEYQDTNRAQYLIALILAGENGNLFVVGDVDQSIYRWRGADYRNLLEFEADHSQTREIKLEQNFRSTGHIVRTAQALIERNELRREKVLFTENQDGDAARLVRYLSDEEEARAIADEIEGKLSEGAIPEEIAVFYRINALSRRFEEELRTRGIRHTVVGAVPFYARREIKDLLAYLRVLKNPGDEQSLSRIVGFTEGIGAVTFSRISTFAREQELPLLEALRRAGEVKAVRGRQRNAALALGNRFERLRAMDTAACAPVLTAILEDTRYLERLAASEEIQDHARADNVRALVDGATEFDRRYPKAGYAGFLDQAALLSATDMDQGVAETVKLMTLHAAKGLEFDDVYVVGLDERLLPLEREAEECDLEEERRLLYVGITRARHHLTLTSATLRMTYGQTRTAMPSMFLAELPDELLRVSAHAGFGGPRPASLRGLGRKGAGGPSGRTEEEDEFPPEPLPPPPEDVFDSCADEDDEAPHRSSRSTGSRLGGRGAKSAARKGPSARRTTAALADAATRPEPPLQPGARVQHSVFGEGSI
ncbi:ATP-dependent helicase, partial [Planctomycetota bacterium]